jgi:hypothetical protein
MWTTLSRIFVTHYRPQNDVASFHTRAQTQSNEFAKVTVAVLDAREGEQVFGVPMARRGMQPVYLEISNLSNVALRLQLVSIDPNYFTPLEAAAANHFSLLRRLSTFGVLGWFVLWVVLFIIPSKLITAYRANKRMDERFHSLGFRLRPIAPGSTNTGYVFTRLDAGTKIVDVNLHATGGTLRNIASDPAVDRDLVRPLTDALPSSTPSVTFTFSIPIPGIAVDYLHKDLEKLESIGSTVNCSEVRALADHLKMMPPATTNVKDTGSGDPVNLVVIGGFDTLISAFAARWDETESLTFATCWKTAKSFIFGTAYRYSPVSNLYLFGRSQDVALQRSRHSINERLHLRLWLTPLRFHGLPVWIGQVSRDIGVRFTLKTWNLTTHRIDPDVDESRDYVLEDLLDSERVDAAGYLDGVGPADATSPRHNLTGDPYITDGKRAIILLSTRRTPPKFVSWD